MNNENYNFESKKNYELSRILKIRESALCLDENFLKESTEILAITDKMLAAIAIREPKKYKAVI